MRAAELRTTRALAALSLVCALPLAGCTTAIAEKPVPEAGAAPACKADKANAFVGQSASGVAEQARSAAGARTIRVIAPGMAVTMDYRGDRLNLKTGDKGVIVAASCG